MKASDFVAAYATKPLATWEAAALSNVLEPAWVPVVVKANGHTLEVPVSSDFARIGEPGDSMLMPMTPATAQRVADAQGALLPTPKLARMIHAAAHTKLTPHPMVPNKGASLSQFAEHSHAVDGQGVTGLTSGQKKDVVVSNIYKPGKVLIYGWFDPAGKNIQPLSSVHGDFYVDYSHGTRLLSRHALLDGKPVDLLDVYTSPSLASLVSDEGPIRMPRYPGAGQTPTLRARGGYAELGSEIRRENALAAMWGKAS